MLYWAQTEIDDGDALAWKFYPFAHILTLVYRVNTRDSKSPKVDLLGDYLKVRAASGETKKTKDQPGHDDATD